MLSESHRIVIDALRRPGPILESFGIDLDDASLDRCAGEALALLSSISDADHPVPDAADPVMIAGARRELADLPVEDLAAWIASLDDVPERNEVAERFAGVFSPSTAGLLDRWEHEVADLRRQRLAASVRPPAHPVTPDQLLFTANALVTVPARTDAGPPDRVYDHPMALDVDDGANEIILGLRGLEAAMAVERSRGTVHRSVPVVLTVSVTHDSIVEEATEFARRSVRTAGPLRHLEVYVVDEPTSRRLLDDVLAPVSGANGDALATIGAGGSYGRHYSFLKAIVAIWDATIEPTTGTFKIDLDQVFPQDDLVAGTGNSALELLTAVPWGGHGMAPDGSAIDLGMVAGALVNADDLASGIFTPDVRRPDGPPGLADILHRKLVPQALSTEAEMMDDGSTGHRLRIHVTGGVTGIRTDAVRRHRPFTPTFIARAEDQAYVLATMDAGPPQLRTLHVPGLFMRHDKHGFADEAITRAAATTRIADLERTMLFTAYVRALDLRNLSELLPFTGSFISDAPAARPLLQLALMVIEAAAAGRPDEAADVWHIGLERLAHTYRYALGDDARLPGDLAAERSAWRTFHDAIDALETSPEAVAELRSILEATRVTEPGSR